MEGKRQGSEGTTSSDLRKEGIRGGKRPFQAEEIPSTRALSEREDRASQNPTEAQRVVSRKRKEKGGGFT